MSGFKDVKFKFSYTPVHPVCGISPASFCQTWQREGRSGFSTAHQVGAWADISFAEGRMKSEKLIMLQSVAALIHLKWMSLGASFVRFSSLPELSSHHVQELRT